MLPPGDWTVEKLIAASPGEPVYHDEHAYVIWRLGMLLRDTGRAQEAETLPSGRGHP